MNIVKKVAVVTIMLAALPAATLLGARYSEQVNKAQEAVTGVVKSVPQKVTGLFSSTRNSEGSSPSSSESFVQTNVVS